MNDVSFDAERDMERLVRFYPRNKDHYARMVEEWNRSDPAEQAFRKLILREVGVTLTLDELTRELVVEPFGGWYGSPAGWVIAVNGSPPRGVMVITGDGSKWPDAAHAIDYVVILSPARSVKRLPAYGHRRDFWLSTIIKFFQQYQLRLNAEKPSLAC